MNVPTLLLEGVKDGNQNGKSTASASLLALYGTAKDGTQDLRLEQQASYKPRHLLSSLNLHSWHCKRMFLRRIASCPSQPTTGSGAHKNN